MISICLKLDHINVYRKIKGKAEWRDMSLSLYNPISPSGQQAVIEWVRLHHESVTGRDGYSDFYKKDLNLPNLNNLYLPLSGGTVTGDTIFTSGLTANTFYATTYLNLPTLPYLPLSGGTVTGGTIFTSGLTANTLNISSTPTTDTQLGTEYLKTINVENSEQNPFDLKNSKSEYSYIDEIL